MKSIFFGLILVWGILLIPSRLPAQGMGVDYRKMPPKDFMELKSLWTDLGEHFAELRNLKPAQGNPDWQAIEKNLRIMQTTLREMQRVDSEGLYGKFTGELGTDLTALQQSAKAKEPNFFQGVDRLEKSCFKCHTAHEHLRP